jgi:ketosteroid isomerase-like protein
MAITRSWHIKDVVLVEFVQGGTSEPGKKPYGYVGATLFWFNAEGRVTEDATYFDELTMEVQLGTADKAASKIEVRPLRAVPAFSATWEQHRARETPEEAKLVAVRDHLYSKLTASSEKDFLDLMTDDIELVAYDEAKDAKGKKAIAEVFGGWKVMFSDIKVEAEHSWACEDYAIFEGTFSGKHTGPWGPIAATKKDFSNHFVDVTRINKDGKVDRMWTYANNAELIEQLVGKPDPR